MSSHHIVRDEQEPALLVAGPCNYTETVGQLLEWSPVLAVSYPILPDVLQWACKIDAVICDPALRFQAEQLMMEQIPYLIWQAFGKKSLLEAGLEALYQAGHKAVNILGEASLLENKRLEYWASIMDLVLYEEDKCHRNIKSGTFEKWLPKGVLLYLPPAGVSSYSNLQHLQEEQWTVAQEGMVTIKLTQGLWVGEQL